MKKRRLWISGIVLLTVFSMLFSQWGFAFAQDDPPDGSTASTSETDPSQTLDSGGEGGAAADGGIMPVADQHTVRFYNKSGTKIGTDRVLNNGDSLTGEPASYAGGGADEEFLHWSCDSVIIKAGETKTVTSGMPSTMNFRPVFETAKPKYTVTFKNASGGTVKTVSDVTEGSRLSAGDFPSGGDYESNATRYFYWQTSSGGSFGEYNGVYSNLILKPYYFQSITINHDDIEIHKEHKTITYPSGTQLIPEKPQYKKKNTGGSDGVTFEYDLVFDYWQVYNGSKVNGGTAYKPTAKDTIINAVWKEPTLSTYTVTFITEKLSGTNDDKIVIDNVIQGAVIKNFPDISKPGATGIKWYDEGGTLWTTATEVTGNVTLRPQWTAEQETVTFEANGKTLGNTTVTYGESVSVPAEILEKVPETLTERYQQDGVWVERTYTFNGQWANKKDFAVWDFSTPVEKDMTLAALYESEDGGGDCVIPGETFLTVTFHLNNGESDEIVKVRKGSPVEPLENTPERKGYSFLGWSKTNTTSTSFTPFDFESTLIEQNTDIYAVWAKAIDVVFDTQGGQYIAVKTIPYNTAVERPEPDPIKDGYSFKGWSKDEQGDGVPWEEYDFSTKITETIAHQGKLTLYAWYESTTAVRFHYNFTKPGSSSEQIVEKRIEYGDALYIPYHVPENRDMPANKAFLGWYRDRAATGDPIKLGVDMLSGYNTTLELYAKWDDSFAVTFDYGTTPGTKTIVQYYSKTNSEEIIPPDIEPTSTQVVTIENWYTDPTDRSENKRANFETIRNDKESITVYAQWETIDDADEITITFNANGGSFLNETDTIVTHQMKPGKTLAQANITIPSGAPQPDALTGGSWYYDANCTKPADMGAAITRDTEFFYGWRYPVVFHCGHGKIEGEDPFTWYVTKGQPTRNRIPKGLDKNLYLEGWSTNPQAGKENEALDMWSFATPITKKVDLYGVWAAVVTYDPRKGNFDEPEHDSRYIYENLTDKSVVKPVDPKRDGYDFVGWFTDVNGGGEEFVFSGDSTRTPTQVAENITLYAHYVETTNKYRLSVSPDRGGKLTADSTPDGNYEQGDTVTLEIELENGYQFEKWEGNVTIPNPTSKKISFTMPAQDVYIQAKIIDVPAVQNYTLEVVTEEGGQYVKGNGSYEAGTKVPVEVRALDGYEFTGWVGPQSGKFANASAMATTYTMGDANTVIIAKFKAKDAPKEKTYQLTVNTNGGGSIVGKPGGKYEAGEKILLEAAAKSGYHFVNWTCDKSQGLGSFTNPNSNPTVFIMPQGHAVVTANFAKDPEPEPEPKPEPDPEPDNGNKWFPSGTSGGSGGGGGGGRGSGSASSSSRILKDKGNGSILNQSTTGTGNSSNSNGSAAPAAAYNVEKEAKGRVSAAKMDEMIEKNQEKDIRINNGNVVFTFEKGTMQPVEGVTWFDFNAEFNVSEAESTINSLAGDSKVLIVHYTHEGQLPAAADIQIQVGKEYAGNTLYYYYYNPQTKALEFVQSTVVSADGWLTVTQTHFSDYVLTSKDLYGDAAKASTAKASSTKEKTRVKLNNMTGSVTANAGAQASQGQTLSATASSGRTLPNAGQKSPAMLIVFGAAALAVSAVSLRKFKKVLAESDEESETDE